MVDEQSEHSSSRLSRRDFLGGVTSVLAAAAYSLEVPDSVAGQVTSGPDVPTQAIASPDGSITVTLDVSSGQPTYSVDYEGETVIDTSRLGFELQNQADFAVGSSAADLNVTGSSRDRVDQTWQPVWDQYDSIRENYTEVVLGLEEDGGPGRSGNLQVRVFNDGFGFRFVFDEEFNTSATGNFVISSERTEYNLTADHDAWWIQNDWNSFEYEYKQTPLSEISTELDGLTGSNGGVHTPVTMANDDRDLYLSIHEANLDDYASLSVSPDPNDGTNLESDLAPLPDGTKVSATAPHMTPWRTVQIADRPGELIESNLVVNLNEEYDPNVFTQGTNWIEPQKFIGVWWLMITGRADWEYNPNTDSFDPNANPPGTRVGNHGAQTGRAQMYMDFASEHGIPGVLVEGWNVGWSSYPGDGSEFDFTEPYPDFDLEAVTSYGASLNPPTQMTMHNETAGDFQNYQSQASDAFGLYDDLGIRTIKTGYVNDSGNLAGEGHNHHNQVLVNHHTNITETAAANRQMLEVHEPIHPTGRRRQYPNLLTREGVYGQEYDSFGTITPEHHVTFPFTRMLGGPAEFTPGIFDMDSGSGGIETTRAKQLAMYPNYFSGLQMVADLPSSYLADQAPTGSVGDVIQAEWGDLDGFGSGASWANAQGEKYVEFAASADKGSGAYWTIEDVPSAGEYYLHLRVANDNDNNGVTGYASAQVHVDGNPQKWVGIPDTGYWDQWDTVSVPVQLNAGDNDISLRITEDELGGFNLDSIAVTESDVSMPTPSEPPITGETVDAFQFIEDVPAAWDDTRVLDAEIGDYMATARQSGDEWYLGAMTDEGGRTLDVSLSFLESGQDYVAEIYEDGADAKFDSNLTDVATDEVIVDSSTDMFVTMAASGGTAVRFRPASASDVSQLPAYSRPSQSVSVSVESQFFIRETFIEATGTNNSSRIGGQELEVLVDGEVVSVENARFAPGASGAAFTFRQTIDDPGSYQVEVRSPDGQTYASEQVTVQGPQPVTTIQDPTGDDNGPGGYTYPTAGAFPDGVFDLESLEIEATPSRYTFTFEVETLNDGFGGFNGFSPHWFILWVRDPSRSGGSTQPVSNGINPVVEFDEPWHYRVELSGFTNSAVDPTGSSLTDSNGNPVSFDWDVDRQAGTVSIIVPAEAFGGTDIEDLEIVPAVGSEDRGSLRPVTETAGGYTFGGGKPGAIDNAPRLMDIFTPSGVDQSDALYYDAQTMASLPFVPIDP